MSWVVFGDFNEIVKSDEKLGWLDRDARQMEVFRECLTDYGLIDLGFVGQSFTWCNGRFGEQRTQVTLDRMVANEEWIKMFPEARVFHRAMAASDHCLLNLSLTQLQTWNRREFGNVNKNLKQEESCLQQLEALNLLYESAEEIQALKKEINKEMIREEMMWNQRWIPIPNSFMVVSPRPQNFEGDLVENLLDREVGGRNTSVVKNCFLPYEAEAILSIPISQSLPDDALVWA
nr:hypothetical protein CFP56_57259 [Quercus suber]